MECGSQKQPLKPVGQASGLSELESLAVDSCAVLLAVLGESRSGQSIIEPNVQFANMVIYVTHNNGEYEIEQGSGMGILTTRKRRNEAEQTARSYSEAGEDILIMGPRMNSYKKL